MNKEQVQELCEGIAIAALNGGKLTGMVLRHNDAEQKTLKDMIVVTAGAPEPQLEGPRGFRVDVTIEIKSGTSGRCAVLHGEALRRMTDRSILRNAAVSSGLADIPGGADFYILDEEISGERSETSNLRKRTIEVPFIINPKA